LGAPRPDLCFRFYSPAPLFLDVDIAAAHIVLLKPFISVSLPFGLASWLMAPSTLPALVFFLSVFSGKPEVVRLKIQSFWLCTHRLYNVQPQPDTPTLKFIQSPCLILLTPYVRSRILSPSHSLAFFSIKRPRPAAPCFQGPFPPPHHLFPPRPPDLPVVQGAGVYSRQSFLFFEFLASSCLLFPPRETAWPKSFLSSFVPFFFVKFSFLMRQLTNWLSPMPHQTPPNPSVSPTYSFVIRLPLKFLPPLMLPAAMFFFTRGLLF